MKENKMGFKLENSYSSLPKVFYKKQTPIPVSAPKIALYNHRLGDSLGLNNDELMSEKGIAYLAGNEVPEGSVPIAQSYAGHQFGHFTMLGDGRAMLIGEQMTPDHKRLDIQLKGSGRTEFSRGGDGRAALGPMLREYIISEAMHGLGIPTTRSLAVVETGESVWRGTELRGAILVRVAESHLRVGTFEFAAKFCELDELRSLADYAIERHYPDAKSNPNPYLKLLVEVIKRQAELVAKWQLVGFIHGVMNTDNMTISGETIDYGPCAFMDSYDPQTVFSSIDRHGRYAYMNQPNITAWNLVKFAQALFPLLDDDKETALEYAKQAIGHFANIYKENYFTGMRAKLGIFNEEVEDEALIESLLDMMEKYEADYTNTFLALTFEKNKDFVLAGKDEFLQWEKIWRKGFLC